LPGQLRFAGVMSSRTMTSSVFGDPIPLAPPKGNKHPKSSAERYFGNPEDVVPMANVAKGYSDKITDSVISFQGPEAFTRDALVQQKRDADVKHHNPHAGKGTKETFDFLGRNKEAQRSRSSGKKTLVISRDQLKDGITDQLPAEGCPPGFYRPLVTPNGMRDEALIPIPPHAGCNQKSEIGAELQWAPGGPKLQGRYDGVQQRRHVRCPASATVADALLYGKEAPSELQGREYNPNKHRYHVPGAGISSIAEEAGPLHWQPPDEDHRKRINLRPVLLQAPPPAAAPAYGGFAEPGGPPPPTWGQLQLQQQYEAQQNYAAVGGQRGSHMPPVSARRP